MPFSYLAVSGLGLLIALRVVHGSATAMGDRAIERTNDLADGDVSGLSAENVPAGPTFLALNKSVVLQLEKDRLEELLRKPLSFSKLRRLNGPPSWLVGQHEERFHPIFRLLRKHAEKSTVLVG